jgi:hypothetical protein
MKVCWPLAVLAEVVGEENKARLGSGPGEGRNLEMFGCYLFFFAAFFFAGMISPPVWVSVRFGLGG